MNTPSDEELAWENGGRRAHVIAYRAAAGLTTPPTEPSTLRALAELLDADKAKK